MYHSAEERKIAWLSRIWFLSSNASCKLNVRSTSKIGHYTGITMQGQRSAHKITALPPRAGAFQGVGFGHLMTHSRN
jgi:hypothetical protein